MAGGYGGGRNRFLSDEEKKNKPKISYPLIKRIFSYMIPYRWQLLLVLAAILASALFGILPAILTGKIIDEGLIGQDFQKLVILVIISFSVLIIANLIGILESYLNTWVAQQIVFDMRNNLYAHLQRMSQRFFSTVKQGEVITRMTSDIDGVQNVISGTLTSVLSNIAILSTSVFAMFHRNWLLAVIGIVIVPLFTIPTKKVGKKRWILAQKSQEKNDEINQTLNETLSISGQMLVKLFTNENYEYTKYENANREMTRLTIKERMAGRWFRMAMSTFTSMGPMLIYFVGGLMIIKYQMTSLTVGDITVMVALLARVYMPVNSLFSIQVDVIRSMALFTRLFSYFDMPAEVMNKPNAIKPVKITGDIAFENVIFTYDNKKKILDNLSFSIPAGKSIAIVGPSGAGKSTIINLIPRFYDVTGGKILLDGCDLRDFDLDTLRVNIGMVTQDTYLFNGTIRENLIYARQNASETDIEQACQLANIHDFIMTLPDKYDTFTGNRGIKLSGGCASSVLVG